MNGSKKLGDYLKTQIKASSVEKVRDPDMWQSSFKQNVAEDLSDIEKLRLKDIAARLKNRENFRRFLMFLLVLQNFIVFAIFAAGMWYNKIAGLEGVFSTLVGGTLLETTALIYIIVKWLFSEISYKDTSQPTRIA